MDRHVQADDAEIQTRVLALRSSPGLVSCHVQCKPYTETVLSSHCCRSPVLLSLLEQTMLQLGAEQVHQSGNVRTARSSKQEDHPCNGGDEDAATTYGPHGLVDLHLTRENVSARVFFRRPWRGESKPVQSTNRTVGSIVPKRGCGSAISHGATYGNMLNVG